MSSQLEPRRPVSASPGLAEIVGELRAPLAEAQRVRSQLKEMQQRGEIAYAYGARVVHHDATKTSPAHDEYVVRYVRLKNPPAKTPRRVAIALAAFGAPTAIGAMIYHARHVFLAAGQLALLIALAAAGVAAVVMVLRFIFGGGDGHCPGAWHR